MTPIFLQLLSLLMIREAVGQALIADLGCKDSKYFSDELNEKLLQIERKLDEIGRMVIFAATPSKRLTNLAFDARVIFDTVSLNIGNGYKTRDGVFTAPEAGFYKFEWTHITPPEKKFVTHLMKNGEVQVSNHLISLEDTDWDSATQSIILHMKVGDRVWLQVRGNDGQYLHEGSISTFNGFKL